MTHVWISAATFNILSNILSIYFDFPFFSYYYLTYFVLCPSFTLNIWCLLICYCVMLVFYCDLLVDMQRQEVSVYLVELQDRTASFNWLRRLTTWDIGHSMLCVALYCSPIVDIPNDLKTLCPEVCSLINIFISVCSPVGLLITRHVEDSQYRFICVFCI